MEKKPDEQIQFMPIGMSIGIGVGVAIGAGLNNIPLWMCIGLSIGVGLGAVIDSNNRSKKEQAESEEQKTDEAT